MAQRAAYFPNACVWFVPMVLEESGERSLHTPRVIVGRQADLSRLIERVHHLAVDVELSLLIGRITDAYGVRLLVPVEPGQLEFGKPSLAAEAVHDLHRLGRSGDGVNQPLSPR